MFAFIKSDQNRRADQRHPLEPMPVDKTFAASRATNPQQCIGCAACVNACPSNALTVETDLKTGELARQRFNLGRCIFCGRCEEVCRRSPFDFPGVRTGGVEKRIFSSSRASRCAITVRLQASVRRAKRSITPSALLQHNGDARAEHHRESLKPPECKTSEVPAAVRPH